MMHPLEQLKADVAEYANCVSGDFLRKFPWEEVDFNTLKFSLEGCFQAIYFAFGNRLYCAPDKSDSVFFSSVIHELYHAYQCHSLGLSEYMMAKAGGREEIEAPAKQAELNAVTWFDNRRIQQWQEHKNEQR